MNFFKNKKIKKSLIALSFLGAVFLPTAASAQFTPTGVAVIDNFVARILTGIRAEEQAEEQAKQTLQESVFFAANQALSQFLNTLSYDVATWIATGGEGEQPLFHTDGWGDYLTNLADGAGGQFLESLGQDWLDLNVCSPSTISLKISLGLGIAETHRPSQPVCRFTEIVDNFASIADEDFLDNFEFVFDPSQNDLGIAWTILGRHDQFVSDQLRGGEEDRREGRGFVGVLSKISNKIKTPAVLVEALGEERFSTLSVQDQSKPQFGPIALEAVDTFINTLVGKLFQRIFQEGFVSDSGRNNFGFNLPFDPGGDLFNPQGQPTRTADPRFLDFLETNSGNQAPYDILSHLASCINPENPGPDDCVINQGFRTAIAQELTLREAINRGLIDGGAPFGSFAYSPDSIYEGIPYRSILILRAHSIVPVGWELAAEAIRTYDDPEQVFGLNDLIAQYNDPSSRYFGLIDDQWVLKAPAHLCRAEGFGSQILFEDVLPGVDNNGDGDFNDVGDQRPQLQVARAQYCADYQTCIEEAADGTCRFYGYCVEERRTWDLQGQSCDELYNTCQSFQNSRTGEVVSYLKNSLDFNGCSTSNAGCQWYCQSYNTISDLWTCEAQDERVLKECETVGGCNVTTTCTVEQGGTFCNDVVSSVDLAISSPCSPGSRWWNDDAQSCIVSASCVIPEGGVNCEINSCDDLNNLLANPSFETGSAPGTLAANWSGDIEYFDQVSGASEKILSGQNSIRLFSFGGSFAADLVMTSDPLSLPAGSYTFISHAFDNLNRGDIEIALVEASSGVVKFSKFTSLTNRWQELSGDFTVAAGEEIVVRVSVSSDASGIISGSAWFDDFKIANSCIVDEITLTLIGTESLDESKIHFDNDVTTCDASSDGCSEFIRSLPNLGTNLIRNSSFEDWPNPNAYPPGWQDGEGLGTTRIEQVSDAAVGQSALKIYNNTEGYIAGNFGNPSGRDFQTDEIVWLKPNTTYRVSLWARADSVVSPDEFLWRVDLLSDHEPEEIYCSANPITSCYYPDIVDEVDPDGFRYGDTSQYPAPGGARNAFCADRNLGTCITDNQVLRYQDDFYLPLTSEWQRFIFDPVTTNSLGENFTLTFISPTDDTSRPLYIDGIQVEEIVTANPIVSSYREYGTVNTINLRKPPKLLGCQGLPDDPQECGNYAYVCQEDEVGCQAYTPVNGGPSIPGVVSVTDYCPLECVGYDAYNQSTTFFEDQESLEYFIPSTARSCNATQVGCSEFTNLDEVAAGGEGLEYYQALRLCELPSSSSCNTFFTWQGSDDTGFQLKVYSLVAEQRDIDGDGSPDTVPQAAIAEADRLPNAWCNNKGDSNGDGLPDCCDASEDVLANPFCREYISSDGDISYQLSDNTISCSSDCHPFRKTALGLDPDVAQSSCENSQGTWDSANQTCIYQAIPNQGLSCAPQAAGCREYIGNSGNNDFIIYYEDFESGSSTGFRQGIISSEALSVGGHSLKSNLSSVNDQRIITSFGYLGVGGVGNATLCSDALPACNESTTFNCFDAKTNTCIAQDEQDLSYTCSVSVGKVACGVIDDLMTKDKTYAISFWAKSAAANINNVVVELASNDLTDLGFPGDVVVIGSANFGPEWRYYTINTFVYGELSNETARIRLIGPTTNTTAFFVDNVEIKEVRDRAYVIRDTWQTPVSCDTNPYTNPPSQAPQFMLGCDQYRDSFGQVHNLKSFENLCREEAVGCEALIDTYNSDSPFGQVFNAGDSNSDIKIPADDVIYLTNRVEFRCSENALGCTLVGSPRLDVDGEVVGYQNEYFINDPDQYETILCSSEEVACEEYITEDGNFYFKDPRGRECEYRSLSITVNPGWYIIGSASDTPNCPLVESPVGSPHPTLRDGEGYVGLCPASQSSCTQFIDPVSDIAKNEAFNGDFSQNTIADLPDDHPDGWEFIEGGTSHLRQPIQLKANTLYTLAVQARGRGDIGLAAPKAFIAECENITSFDSSLEISDDHITASDTPGQDTINDQATLFVENGYLDTQKYSGRFMIPVDNVCQLVVAHIYDVGRVNYDWVEVRETDISYALNSSVDFLTCNGIVDSENGCVLFNDRSAVNYKFGEGDNSYLLFDSDLTDPGNTPETNCVGGCDSNVVLQVRPDRECGEWLSCASNVVRPNPDGSERNVCLSVTACDSLNENGECESARLYEPPQAQIFDSPAQVDQMENLSGFSRAGLDWKQLSFLGENLDGYYAYDQMSEIGEGSDLINGNFEQGLFGTAQPVGWNSGDLDSANWEPFRFSLDSDPGFIKEGGSYLKLNADHKAISEYIDIVKVNEDDDNIYTISGWINTLNLNPQSAGAKILIQATGLSGVSQTTQALADNNENCNLVPGSRFAGWVECDELTVAAGLTWQEVIKQLNVSLDVSSLRLMLSNYHEDSSCNNLDDEDVCLISGYSLFDNLSLKPVLQINSSNLLTRSCRIYPEQGALSCEYIRNDRLFVGQNGYCLLYDPSNPSICLQWWPIDQLRGEIIDELSGYDGRVPLYQCTEGRITSDAGWVEVPVPWSLRQRIANMSNNSFNEFGWWDINRAYETVLAVCHVFGEAGGSYDAAYAAIWQEYGDEDPSFQENRNIRPIRASRIIENEACDNDDSWRCHSWCVVSDEALNLAGAFIEGGTIVNQMQAFDQIFITANTLKRVGMRCLWGDGGTCDYAHIKTMVFGLNHIWGECTEVAKTVNESGVSKPWLSRVNTGSDFRLPDPLNYPYETFVEPFGSIIPLVGTPDSWSGGVDELGNTPFRFANFDFKNSDKADAFYTGRGIAYELNNQLNSSIRAYVGQCEISKSICIRNPNPEEFEIPGCPISGEVCNLGVDIPSASDGIDIAQSIFARSYGIWQWNNSPTVRQYQEAGSVRTCTAGARIGQDCSSGGNAFCNVPANGSCLLDSSCVTGTGVCQLSEKVCSLSGETCDNDSDCSSVTGICQLHECADPDDPNCNDPAFYGLRCFVDGEPTAEICTSLENPCTVASSSNFCGYGEDDGCYVGGVNRGLQNCSADGQSCTAILSGDCSGVCNSSSGSKSGNYCISSTDCFEAGGVCSVNANWNPPVVICTEDSVPILDRPAPGSGILDDEYCYIKPVVKPNISSKDITGADTIRLDFNAIVDPDQLPLKFYKVDWGNGVSDSVSGVSLRNRFNPDNPFTLYHRYDYWQLQSYKDQADANISCGTSSCTVTIEVKIVDNWDKPSDTATIDLVVRQPSAF